MAKLKKEELIEAIKDLSVMDLVEITNELKEIWGVNTEMPMMVGSNNSTDTSETKATEEEKTSFDVVLSGFDAAQKLSVIKALRTVTDLTLGDAKTAVEESEKTPKTIKEAVSKEEAESIKKTLTESGAKIELK